MAQQFAVLNAGSSSIKFAIFQQAEDETLLFRGQVEGIGVAPRMVVNAADGSQISENSWEAREVNHERATHIILQTSIALLGGEGVEGIGHRVVHGGTAFAAPTLVTTRPIKSFLSAVFESCRLAERFNPQKSRKLALNTPVSSLCPHCQAEGIALYRAP